MTGVPFVSVVVPTFNRVDRLRRVLDALGQQDYEGRYEVVVISDGSTDGTDEMLADRSTDGNLVVITQRNQGPAAARNAGLARAQGDLVLFVDDDVVVAPDVISSHVAAHRRAARPSAVIGTMLNPPGVDLLPWIAWEQRMLYKQYRDMAEGNYAPTFRQFYTGNVSVPRSIVAEVGSFDAAYRRAEDVELAMRLAARGVAFVFEPCAVGYHHAERSFASWRDVARAYGRADVDFADRLDTGGGRERLALNYRSRRWPLRMAIRSALRFPRAADRLAGVVDRVAMRLDRTRARRVGQWFLSAVYACDYWRGAAQQLGGAQHVFRLLDGV